SGTVLTLGDNAYPNGTLGDYQNCYDPTWGRHKARTYATLGNRDYNTGAADGAFDYFGDHAGPRGKGYYSFDLGAWHILVLNSNGAYVPYGACSEPGTILDSSRRGTADGRRRARSRPYGTASTRPGPTSC